MPRRRTALSVTALTATVVLGSLAALAGGLPPHTRAQAEPPEAETVASAVAGCRVFPRNNYWNTDISDLPRHPRSRQWMSRMSPRVDLHPDFGPSFGEQRVPYGLPVTVVNRSHKRVKVRFTYAGESDRVRYPLGRDTRIEGGRGSRGDRHALIVDKSRCRLYETFATQRRNGRWRAGSGAVWDLRSNRLRRQGWTSADAAGLPILPGLLRYRETVVRKRVTHAIRFTTDVTDRRHVWPARHDAGSVSNRRYPPMGARFRLKPGFDLRGYRADTRAVLTAMKRYGLVLADNGSPWYFQGESVKGWPTGLIEELKTIPARQFVAVDTRGLRVRPNSGEAHQ